MIVTGAGHWEGKVELYCGQLCLIAETQEQAALLAGLFRFLDGGNANKRLECLLDFTQHVIEQERVGREIVF